MERWVVAYAKILIDKESGVLLQGVYFGGLGNDHSEAEMIARECVNTIKGGTILPRVYRITTEYSLIDALYEAADKFEQMTIEMKKADDILNRSQRK